MRHAPDPAPPAEGARSATDPAIRITTPGGALGRMAIGLVEGGVRSMEAITRGDLHSALATLCDAQDELASGVDRVDTNEAWNGPGSDLDPPSDDRVAGSTASWSIHWKDGHRTTVSIAPDGGWIAMDDDGTKVRTAADEDLRLVIVRHVSGTTKGAGVTLSTNLDPNRLGIGPDMTDEQSAVHVARAIVSLVTLAADDLRLRMDRGDDPVGHDAHGTPDVLRSLLLAGVAATMDADRVDVLDTPAGNTVPVVRYRSAGPFCEPRCSIVGTTGKDIPVPLDRDAPALPTIIGISAMAGSDRRAPYLIASLTRPVVSIPMAPEDAVERLRLMADARPFHRSASDIGHERP